MYMHNVHQVFFCQTRLLEAEWEYAAAADVGQREYNIYKGQKKYPWSEAILVLEKTVKGDQLANFKQGNGDYGGIAGWSDDGADITNEVKNISK
jgi:gliding motility-associated lipoprotein GldJ